MLEASIKKAMGSIAFFMLETVRPCYGKEILGLWKWRTLYSPLLSASGVAAIWLKTGCRLGKAGARADNEILNAAN